MFACFDIAAIYGEKSHCRYGRSHIADGKRIIEGRSSGGGGILGEATVLVQQLLHIKIPIDNSDWFVAPHQRDDMVHRLCSKFSAEDPVQKRSFQSIRKSLLGLGIWF